MGLDLKSKIEKLNDEIDLLEFQLEDIQNNIDHIIAASDLVKVKISLDFLNIIKLIENDLCESDIRDFNNAYKDLSQSLDLMVKSIQECNQFERNETSLYFFEVMLPYIKDNIAKIQLYTKSHKIRICA